MRDPGSDHAVRRFVVVQRVDQDLSASIELTTKNTVWTMRIVQGSAMVLHRRSEVSCSVLVFESLDPITICACEEESNHHVVEAPVDEIIHDCSQRWLSTELFKQAHLLGDPDARRRVDQVAPFWFRYI